MVLNGTYSQTQIKFANVVSCLYTTSPFTITIYNQLSSLYDQMTDLFYDLSMVLNGTQSDSDQIRKHRLTLYTT